MAAGGYTTVTIKSLSGDLIEVDVNNPPLVRNLKQIYANMNEIHDLSSIIICNPLIAQNNNVQINVADYKMSDSSLLNGQDIYTIIITSGQVEERIKKLLYHYGYSSISNIPSIASLYNQNPIPNEIYRALDEADRSVERQHDEYMRKFKQNIPIEFGVCNCMQDYITEAYEKNKSYPLPLSAYRSVDDLTDEEQQELYEIMARLEEEEEWLISLFKYLTTRR